MTPAQIRLISSRVRNASFHSKTVEHQEDLIAYVWVKMEKGFELRTDLQVEIGRVIREVEKGESR